MSKDYYERYWKSDIDDGGMLNDQPIELYKKFTAY